MNVTFQWIPTPDFDLFSPEGTFIRAFVESHELARDGEGMEWGYPGFREAAPSDLGIQLNLDSPSVPFSGTFVYRLLKREDTTDESLVTLCRYGFRTYNNMWGDHPDRLTLEAWAPRPIELTVSKRGTPPPAGQRGQQSAPESNVFGQWKAAAWDFVPRSPEGIATPEYGECNTNREGLPPLPTQRSIQDDPVEPLPPSPGWPRSGL